MSALLDVTAQTVQWGGDLVAQIPNPGKGSQPPGGDKVLTILKWIAWLCFATCVIGVMIAGAKMAINVRRGEGAQDAAGLGWVLAGCIIIGSASGLVGALA